MENYEVGIGQVDEEAKVLRMRTLFDIHKQSQSLAQANQPFIYNEYNADTSRVGRSRGEAKGAKTVET